MIYGAGMLVTAGFIVGFDSEKVSIADAMIDLPFELTLGEDARIIGRVAQRITRYL